VIGASPSLPSLRKSRTWHSPVDPHALHGLGRFDEAIPHYRAAIEKNPTDAAPHNNLAVGFSERGDAARALEHYAHALFLRPVTTSTRMSISACCCSSCIVAGRP